MYFRVTVGRKPKTKSTGCTVCREGSLVDWKHHCSVIHPQFLVLSGLSEFSVCHFHDCRYFLTYTLLLSPLEWPLSCPSPTVDLKTPAYTSRLISNFTSSWPYQNSILLCAAVTSHSDLYELVITLRAFPSSQPLPCFTENSGKCKLPSLGSL